MNLDTNFKYTILDAQTGHWFWKGNDYSGMAEYFFIILDKYYDGEDNGWLRLVDNATGRSMSVVT